MNEGQTADQHVRAAERLMADKGNVTPHMCEIAQVHALIAIAQYLADANADADARFRGVTR